MYLPASLACTCSITSAQLVGFWTTMEYLGSPVKVALSRVSRSMVELPLSTDQDTVVACSQYLQSSLDIPYFDTEQRHSTRQQHSSHSWDQPPPPAQLRLCECWHSAVSSCHLLHPDPAVQRHALPDVGHHQAVVHRVVIEPGLHLARCSNRQPCSRSSYSQPG